MIQELARYNVEFDVPPSKIFGVSDPEGMYLHCEVVVKQEYNNKGVSVGAVTQEIEVINYSYPEMTYENQEGEEVKVKLKELRKLYECNHQESNFSINLHEVCIDLKEMTIEFYLGSV